MCCSFDKGVLFRESNNVASRKDPRVLLELESLGRLDEPSGIEGATDFRS